MTRRRRSPLHLLWALPLAAVPAGACVLAGSFLLCGVSGCSGGGFGPAYGPDVEWITAFVLAALLLALPVGLVAWGSRRARWLTALAVAVLVALVLVAWGWDAKYPLRT